jgi:hypothetical protein
MFVLAPEPRSTRRLLIRFVPSSKTIARNNDPAKDHNQWRASTTVSTSIDMQGLDNVDFLNQAQSVP